ncbi:MAG: MBL fold metallo-hydrolase, partial [Gemmatimonadetes bacterium]|nr:MBL fold metallo-hydrolase [Gemmatimonadota bacterium]
QREEWISTRTGPGGEVLTDEQVARLAHSASLRQNHLSELKAMRIVPPTETFAAELLLDDVTHPVRLIYVGPAHTEGDAVVYLPKQRVLAVGDLLEDALPWVDENTHPVAWADYLDELTKLEADFILPSHGDLHRGTAALERQRAFFRYLVDAVRERYGRGETLEQIKAAIDSEDVPKPLEEGHRGLRRWPEYVGSVVEHTYRDLGGQR